MSVRHQRAAGAIFEQILIMVIALLMPLLISFVIYLTAAANPSGGTLPSVGYGIQCIGSTASGVCTILNAGGSTSVTFPVFAVNAINAMLDVTAFLVAIIEGIRIAPKLMESRED